jgi:thioesterase domain-containing protein
MLTALRTSGTRPPLFFVHDQHGVVPFATSLAQALPPDQPFYVVNANGIDGRSPLVDDADSMVLDYLAAIHGARPMGPLLIGGAGSGGLLATDIARELNERGRQIGPVILADPPLPRDPRAGAAVDAAQPATRKYLYDAARGALLRQASRPDHGLPFECSDARQLHLATLAGVATLAAFIKYMPKPFSGAAELLLPVERAEEFFLPDMPWSGLFIGECIVHISPWDHDALFGEGRESAIEALGFLVDEAVEAFVERPAETGAA